MQGTFATERVGVSAAELEFSKWGWAFREQPIADFGIDAHVEPFCGGKPTGRLIALQIKSGPSYFAEPAEGGWVFRGGDTHLLYWFRHSLPVVLLLHDPESGVTYWAHVTQESVEFTEVGWKMLVPSSQVLTRDAMDAFTALAESAPGASDDPVEASCERLPPTTGAVLGGTRAVEPGGTVRLAALLAKGRATPRLTIESVLSATPSWLPKGNGSFEIAVATYAGEHGHPDLASEAFARAAAYSGQPADLLLGYAALDAAQAGDAGRARELMTQVRTDPASSLLLATADAVVSHLGMPGTVPVPDVLAAATPAERAAEPTCLAFLGVQGLQRRDAMAAVRYFEEGHSAHPEGTALMLQLAQALQLRVGMGLSAVPAEDLRRIELLARRALEQRRRWSGPSSQALAMLIRRQAQVGAFEEALRLATPAPEGAALEHEASAAEVVILGVQVALILRDRDRVGEFALRAGSDHARAVAAALAADPGLPANEKADLWRSVLAEATLPEIQMMAWHRLACLGVWPLPDVEELRAADQMDDMHYDVLRARAMAGGGDITAAVSFLRSSASESPMAAETLVDILQEAGLFDEALEQAERGFQRFGEAVLAHKRLNLLVLADQPDAAADEAVRLLARLDTAPELRLRTYRRLVGHHAFRGDWPTVEQLSRTALSEFPGTSDLQWSIIGAAHNQGRQSRAREYYEQFHPEITAIPHAGLWMSLHMQNGFSQADVNTALDLIDRWPDDTSFETQVMAAFLGAAARRTPGGTPILPDLDPQTLQRFQSRLLTYPSRHPDGPIQAINADPHDLADMLGAQLAPQAERTEIVQRLVREGRIWLGALAAMLVRPYAQALIMRACGIILAVTPDPPEFDFELYAAHAALDRAVIVESSALAVATTIPGRWPQLRGAFTELRFPRNAWSDFQAAQDNLLRDPDTTFSVGYDARRDVLVSHQLTQTEHEYLGCRVSDIGNALLDLTIIPSPELGPFADYSPSDTDPALSPLALAAETGMPLWSDDVVLRALAREHRILAFGTLALLDALTETGRLPDTLRDDVLHLARSYTVDLMLTPEELLSLAAETGYQPGPATAVLGRPVFWAEPAAAHDVLLQLITHVHAHAPQTVITWFRAACTGLVARQPDGMIAEHPKSLAEAVSMHIHADNDLNTQLTRAAADIAEEQPPRGPSTLAE